MKIFNKCLKKNINSNLFFSRLLNLKTFEINNINLLSKNFARNIVPPSKSFDHGDVNESKTDVSHPKIKIEKFNNDFESNFSSQNLGDDKRSRESLNNFRTDRKKNNFQNDFSEEAGQEKSFERKRYDADGKYKI